MSIHVRATATGYYGNQIRREGDEFVIADEQAFSKRWMERVKPAAIAAAAVKVEGSGKGSKGKGKGKSKAGAEGTDAHASVSADVEV